MRMPAGCKKKKSIFFSGKIINNLGIDRNTARMQSGRSII